MSHNENENLIFGDGLSFRFEKVGVLRFYSEPIGYLTNKDDAEKFIKIFEKYKANSEKINDLKKAIAEIDKEKEENKKSEDKFNKEIKEGINEAKGDEEESNIDETKSDGEVCPYCKIKRKKYSDRFHKFLNYCDNPECKKAYKREYYRNYLKNYTHPDKRNNDNRCPYCHEYKDANKPTCGSLKCSEKYNKEHIGKVWTGSDPDKEN